MIRVLRMNRITEGKIKAFFDVEINDIKVNGIKLLQGETELYVTYPRKRGKDEKYYDVVMPITQDVEEAIKKAVLEKYNETEE